MVQVEGRWVLLFSCLSPEMPGAPTGSGGVWSVPVDDPGCPVDVAAAVRLTDESLYVGRVVHHAGAAYFLAFRHQDEAGRFVGGVIDPRAGVTLASGRPRSGSGVVRDADYCDPRHLQRIVRHVPAGEGDDIMATVTFKQAQRWYPGIDKPAVPGIDLEIKDGEFMVLVGPSGCGKSTTLRMLAGLEEVNDGQIFIGDKMSPSCRRRTVTSPWCSRTTRSTRTCRSRTTWRSR